MSLSTCRRNAQSEIMESVYYKNTGSLFMRVIGGGVVGLKETKPQPHHAKKTRFHFAAMAGYPLRQDPQSPAEKTDRPPLRFLFAVMAEILIAPRSTKHRRKNESPPAKVSFCSNGGMLFASRSTKHRRRNESPPAKVSFCSNGGDPRCAKIHKAPQKKRIAPR